jgi:hypothetical protein
LGLPEKRTDKTWWNPFAREKTPKHDRQSHPPLGCKRTHVGEKKSLSRPPAWAFEEQILREAERHGVTLVQVLDTDTGCTFTSSISRFWTHGLRIERGYGVQWALPLNQWFKQDPKQRTLF